MDVVVPFMGRLDALADLRARLTRLRLRSGDTIVVVDNTPGRLACRSGRGGVPVLMASERATPGYARNRGAERGSGEWLVFIDADTEPRPDLLDRYFDQFPLPHVGLLAGGVVDEEVTVTGPGPARYAYLRNTLSQDRTFSKGQWAFAQTANVACRRMAFEAVGGFREGIRSAEDADMSYRLKAAGWQIERREAAAVVHRSRRNVRAFVAQATLHGAGAAWLDTHYPGSFPSRRRPGLVWWGIRAIAKGLFGAVRERDRDRLVWAVYDSLWELSFEFGRSRSVEERAGRRGRLRSEDR